jgi:hypothetical protein
MSLQSQISKYQTEYNRLKIRKFCDSSFNDYERLEFVEKKLKVLREKEKRRKKYE